MAGAGLIFDVQPLARVKEGARSIGIDDEVLARLRLHNQLRTMSTALSMREGIDNHAFGAVDRKLRVAYEASHARQAKGERHSETPHEIQLLFCLLRICRRSEDSQDHTEQE